MNWSSLLKDFKEKVGFNSENSVPLDSVERGVFVESGRISDSVVSDDDVDNDNDNDREVAGHDSLAREKYGPMLGFKKFWKKFRSSSSGKDKEAAFGRAVDIFYKLAKEQYDVSELVTILAETHTFPFDIGSAFVTNIDKIRIHNNEKLLDVDEVKDFFSKFKKDDIDRVLKLLYVVEVLVSGSFYRQPLLDSGILCCFIYILNDFLNHSHANNMNLGEIFYEMNEDSFRIEGSILYIMKALGSHPSAAQSLIGDDSLQLLFQIVVTGSLSVFSKFTHGHISLHTSQLYRHAMQILGLLLINNNGSVAKYIHKHQLINVLLRAVKDFNPVDGDCFYTMGVVDLLMECVELSYRPEAGSIRLKDDIVSGHGYRFLVQFALILSDLQKKKVTHSVDSQSNSGESVCIVDQNRHVRRESTDNNEILPSIESPELSRLLDVLVNLAQISSIESTVCEANLKSGNTRVEDLEAIQMLQDIFLNCNSLELQAEVLSRLFMIFSSHLDNYMLCQQLRTIPLFILNMPSLPESLQKVVFKILEYAVSVVNCVLEQELLSLCCLLQQPITSDIKHSILSFFVKLMSFDPRYKKVLHEVGVLEVLIDNLKKHRFIIDNDVESKNSSKSILMFEDEGTVHIAWDCLDSLLKKTEDNQLSFRSADGFTVALQFLISEIHRSEVLWILSSLIIEDTHQVHSKELKALIEILKSGVIPNVLESQYKLLDDAKCDIFEAVWRILRANDSAKIVFGESTGFSLLLTTLHRFQNGGDIQPSLQIQMKVLSFLLRVITAAVSDSDINRPKLCTILSSQKFYNLFRGSNFLSVDCENQFVQLLLELALEIVIPPSNPLQPKGVLFFDVSNSFLSNVPSCSFRLDKERICNGSAVGVLIHFLLLFSATLQLDLLIFIQKLALASSFNQESLTSIGCVGLLLDIIKPFLTGSSSFLVQTLRIIQILGAYRLSTPELRVLLSYIYEMKTVKSENYLVNMMSKLIHTQDTQLENVSLAPFVELNMSKMGYASIQVSLGERTWPPSSGYSFVCWLQCSDFLKDSVKEQKRKSKNDFHTCSTKNVLRIFSVGSVDDEDTFFAELYAQDNGILTLATNNSATTCLSCVELVEKKWHHLAIVHSKPNALAGLFQDSVAYVYLNGKLKHVGNLGYSMSPMGKPLQITIGTPVVHAKVSDHSWRLRSCYLFEEALTPGSIFFMYILGRGYRGTFQDSNLLQFVPIQACGGGCLAILNSLDMEASVVLNTQKVDKQGNSKANNSNTILDFERLSNNSSQLMRKKLIFAFDGTPSDTFKESGILHIVNLVDPLSTAASALGGIPRFGRLNGDSYICYQQVIGDSIRSVGGIAVILSFVEASETKNMLRMSLALLACALYQNPRNVFDMQSCRGYHLLAVFLHRRMALFDMLSLCICFHIAASEEVSYFLETPKLGEKYEVPIFRRTSEIIFKDSSLQDISDKISSVGFDEDFDDFTDSTTSLLFKNLDRNENLIILSNIDMVEHVLLDWTLWEAFSVSIQLSILRFLEKLISTHCHKDYNLRLLRKINLVQYLLVFLQKSDIEVQILEKVVVLLGVILKDGFIVSELEVVVRFVIMTFDPLEAQSHHIIREKMGKHVHVRNFLLEMLIELQISINDDELIEKWYKTVSSKLITCFLDQAIHPSSMRLIINLLGVCLTSSSTYDLKFFSSAGYQNLIRVLPSFYDSPDIYYIIFCLIFGKSVDLRFSDVYMEDFHALISNNGSYLELRFPKLLDPVIAMAKYTFDRLSMQAMVVQKNNSLLHSKAGFASMLIEATSDNVENLKDKTSQCLMGGEAEAPTSTTLVLRFMVDLAKMCPPFSSICRRVEFLKSCVDLYFSCARASCALNIMNDLSKSLQDSIKENVNYDIEGEERVFTTESRATLKNDDAETIIQNFNSISVEHMMFTASNISENSNDKHSSKRLTSVNTFFPINPKVLDDIDNLKYGGGPCSASATAILDFIAIILADIISEQIQATQKVENILDAFPFYVNIESVLVYQGFCLSRFMNFLERCLSQDDKESDTKLDKSRWAVNLEALSSIIVDRLYMGVFSQTSGVIKTLEFLFSMLHLANKDGYIEEAMSSSKGFLSLTRLNSRRVEPYINALLKNVNRVIMYCFLPSVLIANQDICMILQLIIANKQLVFCPSNDDTDFIHSLSINLIRILSDQTEFVRNLAVDIMKYMLLHKKSAFEGVFILKSKNGNNPNILREGFEKLLNRNISPFFEWFYSIGSPAINRVLKEHASITWENFIIVSEKFRNVRIKGLEDRCICEMEGKLQDVGNLDQIMEQRRDTIEHYRDAMSTELCFFRQDKYGRILHAESDCHTFVQQLVQKRGIFSLQNSNLETEWQLCPIEGPYRMRKKLQHCQSNTGPIKNIFHCASDVRNMQTPKENDDSSSVTSRSDYESGEFLKGSREFHSENSVSVQCSMLDSSSDIMNIKTYLGFPKQSSSLKNECMKITENKPKKALLDNGEYLIRPYLEPFEKIWLKYNCERVVGLNKHDGIFLIGNLHLYVIENFYIDDYGCICEKQNEDDVSVIDCALGVKNNVSTTTNSISDFKSESCDRLKIGTGGIEWSYNGGNLPHLWHMWKFDSIHNILRRDYLLRPVAIEIFSTDGCNNLLVFHKNERDCVFHKLISINLPKNTELDGTTISGPTKHESSDGNRLLKVMAKSLSKRWQSGEISNFQYLMHLNTLAGRGYSDLTQYPVFPWIIADYSSDDLDLTNTKVFRKLDKTMGCQTAEGEEEYRQRYESWDDPEIPKFNYGSHYTSAGIVLFYLLRLPPFSTENRKLNDGQFDHADRLFNSIQHTWSSASGCGNISDVKELIPEFFYMPEFLENKFNLDLGKKQSGEKVGDVLLPPWAKGSAREFIRKHREALECDYVCQNLHNWIDLIFGYKQRGKAAEEATNVFYHYTYEGSVDIDSLSDPTIKASTLAQINHFGQTPKQLFLKPHVKRRSYSYLRRKIPLHLLQHCSHLVPHDIQKRSTSSITQIASYNDTIVVAGTNNYIKPPKYNQYLNWGFADRSLRFLTYGQNKLLSTHENLHGGYQIQCVGVSNDGRILVTGADDGVVVVWKIINEQQLCFERALFGHTCKITCLYVSQSYTLLVTGSDDCSVIIWDLSGLTFVKQLEPKFPSPVTAIHVNDLTGEIVTGAGALLAIWSVNGVCLAIVNTSQLQSDPILSLTTTLYSDWEHTNWFVTGHQSGCVQFWNMIHSSSSSYTISDEYDIKPTPEYRLVCRKVLNLHKHPVTALHLTKNHRQLLTGDFAGHLISWKLSAEKLKSSS